MLELDVVCNERRMIEIILCIVRCIFLNVSR